MSRGPTGSISMYWPWWRSLPAPSWSLRPWRWRSCASRANSRCWACLVPRRAPGSVRCWRRAQSLAHLARCWAPQPVSGWPPCCSLQSAATWAAAISADRDRAWRLSRWRSADSPCWALRSACWDRRCRPGPPRARPRPAHCAAAAPKILWPDSPEGAGRWRLQPPARCWLPCHQSEDCRSALMSRSHCGWWRASPACRCSPARLADSWHDWPDARCGAGRQPGWPPPASPSRRARLLRVSPVWWQALP